VPYEIVKLLHDVSEHVRIMSQSESVRRGLAGVW